MPKIPSISSRELVRLLERAEQYLSGRDQQIMLYIQEWLKGKDILLLYRWEGKPWIQYIAKEY
jgi:hypothetical protein